MKREKFFLVFFAVVLVLVLCGLVFASSVAHCASFYGVYVFNDVLSPIPGELNTDSLFIDFVDGSGTLRYGWRLSYETDASGVITEMKYWNQAGSGSAVTVYTDSDGWVDEIYRTIRIDPAVELGDKWSEWLAATAVRAPYDLDFVLEDTGDFVSSSLDWLGSFVDLIVNQPLILVFVLISFTGLGVGLLTRLYHVNR